MLSILYQYPTGSTELQQGSGVAFEAAYPGCPVKPKSAAKSARDHPLGRMVVEM